MFLNSGVELHAANHAWLVNSVAGHSASDSVLTYENGTAVDAMQLLESFPETQRQNWKIRSLRLKQIFDKNNTRLNIQQTILVKAGSARGVQTNILVIKLVFPERSFFDFDKVELRENTSMLIELIATALIKDVEPVSMLIVGHTDSVGTTDYNDRLSGRRASSVLQNLTKLGVPSQKLHTAAMGMRQPTANNQTDEGRALNRRIEFFISSSLDANIAASQAMLIDPQNLPSTAEKQPISPNVEVKNSNGQISGGIIIRPPRQIMLRPFRFFDQEKYPSYGRN